MVFQEMFRMWKQKGLLNEALEEIDAMVKEDKLMFRQATSALFEGKKIDTDIYKEDREVNRHEMSIRRKILEHLSISPKQDVSSSLILIIATKDFERIGDYCKNILELSYMYKKALEGSGYVFKLIRIEEKIQNMFDLTQKAFFETDTKMGKKVMDMHSGLSRELDTMIEDIIKDRQIETKKAIICVLLARYFKRISAHLKNIARTVVDPFDRIHKTIELKELGKNVPAWKAKSLP